jgi:hypothetical protein
MKLNNLNLKMQYPYLPANFQSYHAQLPERVSQLFDSQSQLAARAIKMSK